MAFDLLNLNQRTAFQSIIVFITDGKDSDGESVRCGEGIFFIFEIIWKKIVLFIPCINNFRILYKIWLCSWANMHLQLDKSMGLDYRQK
jgi:hypothetical protein